jgi:transposase-like protein
MSFIQALDLTRLRALDRLARSSSECGQVPRSRLPYPPEFRAQAIHLVRSSGEPIARIAKDLGVSDQTLRNRVNRTTVDVGRKSG